MSDDIRGVPNTSGSMQHRRSNSVGARERLLEIQEERQRRRREDPSGREEADGETRGLEDAPSDSDADEAQPAGFEDLVREIDAANERLRLAGRGIRLQAGRGSDEPFIEVLVPDPEGVLVVTRRIDPADMAGWLVRIETSEGIILDESF